MAKQKENGVSGRPTVYPGKRRDRPVQVALTDEGLRALDRGVKRTGYNKANYIERLLREEDDRQRAQRKEKREAASA